MKVLTMAVLALGLAGGVHAASDENEQARKDLERARQEVEKARADLQRATRDLARSMAKVERDNPRAQYFEYMTDPDRAVLGVLIPDDVEHGEEHGVRLLAVTPGGGAEKAGLKAGDLLTALNGTSLARDGKRAPPKQLREALKKLKAGDRAKVEYERSGKRSTATIVTQAPEPEMTMFPPAMIQEWMDDADFDKWAMPGVGMFHFKGPAIRGLELAKLDEDLGSYFKTKEGVLVVKAPKSGALNLKSGDVIQKIDGAPVEEPVTVLDKLRSRGREEQSVKLEIMRQGRKMELEGKIPVADARGPRIYKDKKRVVIEHDAGEEDEDGT